MIELVREIAKSSIVRGLGSALLKSTVTHKSLSFNAISVIASLSLSIAPEIAVFTSSTNLSDVACCSVELIASFVSSLTLSFVPEFPKIAARTVSYTHLDVYKRQPWLGRDWCMAAGLTVLFAVMAFVNLGSMKAPQTAYEFEKMIATEMRWCFGLMEV